MFQFRWFGLRLTTANAAQRIASAGEPFPRRFRTKLHVLGTFTRLCTTRQEVFPWRLLRNAADLATCFVGVSFYRSLQGDRLLTSVAQVFNERGEGVIVKGAQAQLDKDDRQPHLSEDDARLLLKNAVQVYRREHRTSPARLVVHKTSKMTEGEVRGFRAAGDEHQIDAVELVSVRRSLTRLFREGTYPLFEEPS